MAEPDWTLLNAVLRQLQADMADVKSIVKKIDQRLDGIEKEVGSTRMVARQAWGVAQDVELTTQQRTEMLERELIMLKARVDALEHSDA